MNLSIHNVMGLSAQWCLLTTIGLFTNYGWAHNNYFLPGDAFFSCHITLAELEEAIMQQPKTSSARLPVKYARLSAESMRCGTLGTHGAVLGNIPQGWLQTLHQQLSQLESENRITGTDSSGSLLANEIRIFVYNRSFDLELYRIGLRYNEDWHSYQLQHKEHAVYDEIGDRDATIHNWRHAIDVKGLTHAFSATKSNNQIMTIDWHDIQIVIPLSKDITHITNNPKEFNWSNIH